MMNRLAGRLVRDVASVLLADVGLGGTTVGVPMEPLDQGAAR